MKRRFTGVFLLRKIFRYQLTAVFFIVGQLVVFSSVFGALGIYNKAFDKEKDRLAGIYQNRIQLDVTTINQSDIFTSAGLDVTAGNVLLAGKLPLGFQESGLNTISEVILKANEDFLYSMLSGRLPGSLPEDAGKRLVALGRDKYKYAWEQDGKKYVTFEGEVYEVVGVIGSAKSDYWDYKVVFHIGCLGENTLRTIQRKGNYTIELSSNREELQDSYARIYGNIMSVEPNAGIASMKIHSTGGSTVDNTLGRENIKVNMIVYIFCILNCMVMSEFWIIQRRKELAVKKAFGMSNLRILAQIAGNITALSAVSLVLFILGDLLLALTPVRSQITITLNGFTCLWTVLAVLLTVGVTMIYPVWKVLRFNVAEAIGNSE